jgi:hypothetical protein
MRFVIYVNGVFSAIVYDLETVAVIRSIYAGTDTDVLVEVESI